MIRNKKFYNILSLDGGGVHGLASVLLLKRLFKINPNFLDNIDLIAGTSIGAIVGLGLAFGRDLDHVEENFLRGMPLAFHTTPTQSFLFKLGLKPKYDNTKFAKFLSMVFEDKCLKDLQKKVLITSFCIRDDKKVHKRCKSKFFHNFDGVDSDGEEKIACVAMASSSAPIFFPTYKHYIDGAMVANNPAMCAIVQTQDMRAEINPRPTLNDISMISIGDVRDLHIEGSYLEWGYMKWIVPFVQLFNDRDNEAITYQCEKLLGDRFRRIQPVINGPMDNFDEVKKIRDIADAYPLDGFIDWMNKYWV